MWRKLASILLLPMSLYSNNNCVGVTASSLRKTESSGQTVFLTNEAPQFSEINDHSNLKIALHDGEAIVRQYDTFPEIHSSTTTERPILQYWNNFFRSIRAPFSNLNWNVTNPFSGIFNMGNTNIQTPQRDTDTITVNTHKKTRKRQKHQRPQFPLGYEDYADYYPINNYGSDQFYYIDTDSNSHSNLADPNTFGNSNFGVPSYYYMYYPVSNDKINKTNKKVNTVNIPDKEDETASSNPQIEDSDVDIVEDFDDEDEERTLRLPNYVTDETDYYETPNVDYRLKLKNSKQSALIQTENLKLKQKPRNKLHLFVKNSLRLIKINTSNAL